MSRECPSRQGSLIQKLYLITHHGLLVLAAGFPCNSFSPLGSCLGEKCPKYGNLGGYVVKVAAVKRPVAVLLENVPGFFRDGKPYYKNMVDAFKEAGYVCHHNMIAAWEFGLPQHRRRGFIVAVRNDVPGVPFRFPRKPERKQVTLRSFLLAADSPELWDGDRFGQGDVIMQWRKTVLPGLAWDDIVDNVDHAWRSIDGLRNLGTVKKLGLGLGPLGRTIYHDLGHHPCVTGSTVRQWIFTRGTDDEGPVIRKIHPHEVRRIQGFPDDFELHQAKKITIGQLGNAVPPPMVEWIGHALAEQYQQAFVDEDDRITEKTPQGRKSSKISKRKSSWKSSRKSKHKSKRKPSRKSTHKSRKKSGHSQIPNHRHTSRGSHNPSRKRRFSSDSDEAPPAKRQHRQLATSPDSQSGSSTSTAESDGTVNASMGSSSLSRPTAAGFDGNLRAPVRRRHRN